VRCTAAKMATVTGDLAATALDSNSSTASLFFAKEQRFVRYGLVKDRNTHPRYFGLHRR
jgi:hypothetical protein